MRFNLLRSKEETGGGDSKEVKPEVNKSLDDALAEAEAQFEKDHPELRDNATKDETKETSDKETKDKSEEDEEEDEEADELTPEQLVHAKTLLKLLSNPKTARSALTTLATSAGLELTEIQTKKEEKEAKKTIKEIVQAKLGSKYEFLSAELGDLLQDLFETQVIEKTKDIRDKVANSETRDRINEIKTAQQQVLAEYSNIDAAILQEVVRISKEEELLQGKNVSDAKFFKSCLILAADNLNKSLVKKTTKVAETTKKRSPLDELANKGSGSGSGKAGSEPKKTIQVKSEKDAINLAVQQLAEAASKK